MSETKTENTLIVIEELSPETVFKAGGIQPILDRIREQVIDFIPDVTTTKGKAEIASRANKVARSKVALDNLGKELKSQYQEKIKPIDEQRRIARDFCDALKEEVRKPLTDAENRERERVEGLNRRLSAFEVSPVMQGFDSVQLDEVIKLIELEVIDDSWQEFKEQARALKVQSLQSLHELKQAKEKAENEAAELERLRAQEVEQQRKDREAQIARDAAAKAEREKEEALARQKKESEQALEKAEQEKIKAVEAEKQKALAEKQRQEAEAQAKLAEAAKREGDVEYMRQVNNTILAALISETPLDDETARTVISAISKGKIPNVLIKY